MISNSPKEIFLSLCITCMGRKHHLERTLRANLDCLQQFEATEVILVDYSSPDGLEEWIQKNFLNRIQSGHLVYAIAPNQSKFVVAHAKNIAHKLASGEVVCNLDADNIITPPFVTTILETFRTQSRIFSWFGKRGGCFGRIAMRTADFKALGGYDERMIFGWGFEDNDLVRRATGVGLREVLINNNYAISLEHADEDRVRYCRAGNMQLSRAKHKAISRNSMTRSDFVVNSAHEWGTVPFLKIFKQRCC